MKILVYGVTNWNTQAEAETYASGLREWHYRINAFIDNPRVFMTAGSYSNPEYNPINVELIQANFHKTKAYSRDWSYYHAGFLTGLWYGLLNPTWDLLIHCQCRNLLGQTVMPQLEEFLKNSAQLCAPKWTSKSGTYIETGFMVMKPDAVKRFVTEGLRPSFSRHSVMNVEDEAYRLFKGSWYNPWPEITSTRKRDWCHPQKSPMDLSMSAFLKLPMVAGSRHCSKRELELWLREHPIEYDYKGILDYA